MGTHVIGAHRLGTRLFHDVSCSNAAQALRSRQADGTAGRRRELEFHFERLAQPQLRMADDRDTRQQRIVREAGGGAADAKHPIALSNRPTGSHAHRAAFVALHVIECVGEPTFVRPELQDIALLKRTFGSYRRRAVLHPGDAAHEHAAIVRAAVAHHGVSAFAFKIRCRETA